MNKRKSQLILATGAAFAATAALSPALAAGNPFAMQTLSAGYQLAQADMGKKADGKCGEAKCGAAKAAAEKKKEGNCGADKRKDANCGADKKKEANCGASKKMDASCGAKK